MKNILLFILVLIGINSVSYAQSNYYIVHDTTKNYYENKSYDPRDAKKETTIVVRVSNIITPNIIESIPISKIKSLKKLDESTKTVDVKKRSINVAYIFISLLSGIYCYDKFDESSMIANSISRAESDYNAMVQYNIKYRLPAPAPLDLSDLKSQKSKNSGLAIAAGFISILSLLNISEAQSFRIDIPTGKVTYELDF